MTSFKDLRKKRNLSIEDVSLLLNRKPNTIYKYETSVRLPSMPILSEMKRIYNVNFDVIENVYEHYKEIYERRELNGKNVERRKRNSTKCV